MFEPKFIFGIGMTIIYWSVGAMILLTPNAGVFGKNGTLRTVFAIGIIIYGFFRLFKAIKQYKENQYSRSEEDE